MEKERKTLQQNDGFHETGCSYSNHWDVLRRTDSTRSEGSLSVGGVDTYTINPYPSSPTSCAVYPDRAVVKALDECSSGDDKKSGFIRRISSLCIFDLLGTSICCGGSGVPPIPPMKERRKDETTQK